MAMPQYDPILNSDFARIDKKQATEKAQLYNSEKDRNDRAINKMNRHISVISSQIESYASIGRYELTVDIPKDDSELVYTSGGHDIPLINELMDVFKNKGFTVIRIGLSCSEEYCLGHRELDVFRFMISWKPEEE
jgi:hypothetical protein